MTIAESTVVSMVGIVVASARVGIKAFTAPHVLARNLGPIAETEFARDMHAAPEIVAVVITVVAIVVTVVIAIVAIAVIIAIVVAIKPALEAEVLLEEEELYAWALVARLQASGFRLWASAAMARSSLQIDAL